MPVATAEAPPRALTEVPKQVQPIINSPEAQMPGVQNDPNSVASIAKKAQVLQGQSITDSMYDPPLPPPAGTSASGFTNYGPGVAHDNLWSRIILFIAFLAIIYLVATLCSKGSINTIIPKFKIPRLFRK
jgi:hypothetical protein